jgi:hypothetical protein
MEVQRPEKGHAMGKNTGWIVGGAVAVILAFVLLPWYLTLLVLVGIPVAGYLMLDPSQRRKLRNRRRGQIGQ